MYGVWELGGDIWITQVTQENKNKKIALGLHCSHEKHFPLECTF